MKYTVYEVTKTELIKIDKVKATNSDIAINIGIKVIILLMAYLNISYILKRLFCIVRNKG